MQGIDATMVNRGNPHFEWQFWLQWTLATVLGWVLSLVFSRIADHLVWPFGLLISLAVWPTLISLMQWLPLRQKVPCAGWWVGVNTITWLIVMSTLAALGPFVGNAWNMEGEVVNTTPLIVFWVAAALATLLTGVIPMFFFLHRGVERAVWWIPTNFVSLSLIGFGSLPLLFHPTLEIQLALGGAQGTATGLVLAWMLNETRKRAANGN